MCVSRSEEAFKMLSNELLGFIRRQVRDQGLLRPAWVTAQSGKTHLDTHPRPQLM